MTSSRSPALQTITTVLTKRTKPSLPDCRAKLKVRASASRPWRLQVTGWSAAHERRATSNDGTSVARASHSSWDLAKCAQIEHNNIQTHNAAQEALVAGLSDVKPAAGKI